MATDSGQKFGLDMIGYSNYGREAVDFHQADCKKPKIWPLTLHTIGQSLKAVTLQIAYMIEFFDQGDGLWKEVWAGHHGKPKLWSRGRQFSPIKLQETKSSASHSSH